MKMYFKTYESFSRETEHSLLEAGNAVNEGLFDRLLSSFQRITNLFSKDPEKLKKSTQAAVTETGMTKFDPKAFKVNDTVMITMGDGKTSALDLSMALTKLADLADGSGLFQMVGTTSLPMLKGLVPSGKVEDLTKDSVMVMIAPAGFEKGKPMTMKLLKNILPDGKDYITKDLFTGAATDAAVEKIMTKVK